MEEIYSSIMSVKHKYLEHQFQVENDRFHWKKIIDSQQDFSTLFHMDYSGNVSGTPKFEPQEAHLSKRQFSLHCTVGHVDDKGHNYIYHLADDLNHDWLFTSEVLNDFILLYIQIAPSIDLNLTIVLHNSSLSISFLSFSS